MVSSKISSSSTHPLVGSTLEQVSVRGVAENEPAFAVEDGERILNRLDRAQQAIAREPFGRFGALALGDVADRARDEAALLGLERAQADLDRELAAVTAEPEELQARAHAARVGRSRVPASVDLVLTAVARGDELLDRLPDELAARVAEERFGLRVDDRDAAALVHDDDGVGRRLEQRAKLLLRAPLLKRRPPTRSGLRLISSGNSVPSARRPYSSSPEPMGRALGALVNTVRRST
jgi:hypothetical protein